MSWLTGLAPVTQSQVVHFCDALVAFVGKLNHLMLQRTKNYYSWTLDYQPNSVKVGVIKGRKHSLILSCKVSFGYGFLSSLTVKCQLLPGNCFSADDFTIAVISFSIFSSLLKFCLILSDLALWSS